MPKDDTGELTICRIISLKRVEAIDEHGFKGVFRVDDLVRIDPDSEFNEQNLAGSQARNIKDAGSGRGRIKMPGPTRGRKKKAKRQPGICHIDLHLPAVPKRYTDMHHLPIIEQKMNYLDAELRKVLNGNYHRLEINHGIGEGILKKAVTDRLRQYGFEFHDFSYSNPGTTVVNLREEP